MYYPKNVYVVPLVDPSLPSGGNHVGVRLRHFTPMFEKETESQTAVDRLNTLTRSIYNYTFPHC